LDPDQFSDIAIAIRNAPNGGVGSLSRRHGDAAPTAEAGATLTAG